MTRRAFLLAIALVAPIALVGCGVTTDSSPRDIPPEKQRELGAGSSDAPGAGAQGTRRVYFLSDAIAEIGPVVQGVARDVPSSPDAVLTALLEGPSGVEVDRRLRTSIPPGTTLQSARLVPGGIVEADVSEEFFLATGEEGTDAVAQIVYTATALDGVRGVRLLVEGQPNSWPRGDGSLEDGPLTRVLYPSYEPNSGPSFPPIPTRSGSTGSG